MSNGEIMIIKIKIKPNSGRQEIIQDGKTYNIYLKSVPQNNKANIELLKLLQKYFKRTVKIKSGFTSREKTIEVFD